MKRIESNKGRVTLWKNKERWQIIDDNMLLTLAEQLESPKNYGKSMMSVLNVSRGVAVWIVDVKISHVIITFWKGTGLFKIPSTAAPRLSIACHRLWHLGCFPLECGMLSIGMSQMGCDSCGNPFFQAHSITGPSRNLGIARGADFEPGDSQEIIMFVFFGGSWWVDESWW